MEQTFSIDQKSFSSLLSSMQPICSRRTALDATSYILFEVNPRELILKSTDLEICLQASCPLAESNIETKTTFLVSGRRIFDIVRELESQIRCNLQPHQITLVSDSFNLSLNIKNDEEFPPFPERIENLLHFDSALLLKMIESVAFLIPQNNPNPGLNGLLFEIANQTLTMTTTDGHCLAQASAPNIAYNESKSWLIPKRAIFELKKLLESCEDKTIFIGICSNQLVFSGESFNFFTKLLADQFPHYQSILQRASFQEISINRPKFLKTLRRSVCLLSGGQFIPAKFSFNNEFLKVSLHNKEVGSLNETLPLDTKSQLGLEVRFFPPYLLNGLQSFSDDSLKFYLKNSLSPIIFESQNQSSNENDYHLTYLVMPVSPSTM